ncbi:MAG: transglycosylase SLT domain-containing protein [Myxococcota bacterium]
MTTVDRVCTVPRVFGIMVVMSLGLANSFACSRSAPTPPPPAQGSATATVQNHALSNSASLSATQAPSSSTRTAEAPDPSSAHEPSPPSSKHPAAKPQPLGEVRELLRAGYRDRAMAVLRVSIPGYSDPQDMQAGRYILGRLLIEEGKPAEGLQQLSELPTPFETFETQRLALVAQGQLNAQRFDDAVATTAMLAERDRQNRALPKLWLALARGHHARGALEQALAALKPIEDHAQLGPWTLRLAGAWRSAKEPDKARALHRTLITKHPTHPAAQPTASDAPGEEQPPLLVKVEELSDDERYHRARRLMAAWGYHEAREEFRRLHTHPRYGVESRWNTAVISLRKLRDDPLEADKLLDFFVKTQNRHREEAHYLKIRSLMRQELYTEALKLARRYDERFPDGAYRERMDYYRGWMPYDHGRCEEAMPHLKAYVDTYDNRHRSVVHGFYAWCAVRLKRWPLAVRAFGELIRYGGPLVRGKAHYWRAYALWKLERNEAALKELTMLGDLYPLTYYGMLGLQLAAQIEGRDPTASTLPWPEGGGKAEALHPMAQGAWDWPELSGSLEEKFATVRRLVELAEVDRAREAWNAIHSQVERHVATERRLAFVRFMGHQVEDYKRGWRKVTRGRLSAMTQMPDPSDVRWLLAYPRAYAPLVERLAQEFDLPSHLVYAIMRQESRYNPRAISGADAVGALQMIPQTARRVADEMGVTYDPVTFPRPDVGFRYSVFYIDKHRDLWNGQLVPTAASYNGGPTPIARWIRQQKGATLPFLIEEFAYNESRIYCRKVAEHTLRYLYLYENDPVARGRWLDALFPVQVDDQIPDDVGY